MGVSSPIRMCAKNLVHPGGLVQHQGSTILNLLCGGKYNSCCLYFYPTQGNYACLSVLKASPCSSISSSYILQRSCSRSGLSSERGNFWLPSHRGLVSTQGPLKRHLNMSLTGQSTNVRLSVSNQGMHSKIKGNMRTLSWSQGFAPTGLIFGLLVCYSSTEPTHAEAAKDRESDCNLSYVRISHGKKVYTDYSITGIPGDGRCLFRSVAHGACLRAGKPAPSESLQKELADDLRARVADEFIKRKQETEWFVEGDFDTYVSQMRKPHVWGGEPELFVASHVLKMPITVYMYDENAGGLISIAEYGQEYGKENPIRVMYHGFGHYDALQIPGRNGQSKL
uniref:Ubiquitin thioesterase OTU n=2 Tax=Rhizophora mucronata TaxID=61149 RepID=A0A2P2KQX1_RHIMU